MDESIPKELVRQLREAVGLSHADAEKLVHVDQGGRTWRRWELGESVMRPAFVELFCLKTGQPFPPRLKGEVPNRKAAIADAVEVLSDAAGIATDAMMGYMDKEETDPILHSAHDALLCANIALMELQDGDWDAGEHSPLDQLEKAREHIQRFHALWQDLSKPGSEFPPVFPDEQSDDESDGELLWGILVLLEEHRAAEGGRWPEKYSDLKPETRHAIESCAVALYVAFHDE